MKARLKMGLLLAFFSAAALAQTKPGVVAAHAVLAADGALPGSALKAAVVAEVSPGFHINDHKPTLDYLIPTELKLETSSDLGVDKIVYPKGQAKKFEFSDTALSVYEGTLLVGTVVKVARTVRPGIYTLKGKLNYQACNDQACFPPSSVPVSLTVKVVPRGVPVKHLNADVFRKIQFD